MVEFELTVIVPWALPGPDVAFVGETVPCGVPSVAVPTGVPFGFRPMIWTFTPAGAIAAVVMPTPVTVPEAVAPPKPVRLVAVTGTLVSATPTDGGLVTSVALCAGVKPLAPVADSATPYVTPFCVVLNVTVLEFWFRTEVWVKPAGAVNPQVLPLHE